ncbi:DUF3073 domain-containing protein [Pseudoglutamicibacter albus]|uniref:DUF3073 domain-containing protein n=1 Tax=Pseudoglutamicibacter albus TaxID=98671 RepID=UPI000C782D9E|nr:DUF3073 domain-containing protein [Pseudoglutamicibacter albus]PKY80150.1 DUF3073 domain-containing protein [Pseudoglutamicibacter albus]WIK83740.1 DUF3073 domain-containing protein [Pseudoglutamicibacter albus]
MGRGRQKAKATRQAREMKYFTPGTDLSALERELGIGGSRNSRDHSEEQYEDDPYADLAARYGAFDDDDDEDDRRY